MERFYFGLIGVRSGRVKGYLRKVYGEMNALEKQKERLNGNSELAKRIDHNLALTVLSSEEQIRLFNLNERSKQTNPVNPKRSLDQVYRKISRIEERRHHPYILAVTEDLKIKIENRQMTEEEYNHIKQSSEEQLFTEWYEHTRKKYEKRA